VGEAYWAEEARTSPAQYVFLSKVLKGTGEPATTRAARKGASLPPAFDAWFTKATALEPELRFDRASSLVAALAEVLGAAAPRTSLPEPVAPAASPTKVSGGTTPMNPSGGAPPVSSSGDIVASQARPRSKVGVGVGVGVAVAALAAVVFLGARGKSDTPPTA